MTLGIVAACGVALAVVAFVWACGRLASAADVLMEKVNDVKRR